MILELFMQTNFDHILETFKKSFIFLFTFFIISVVQLHAQDKFVVVLDAGHGGKDPGKVAKNIYEKNVALSVVLLTGKYLEAHKDIKVVYTRKKDVFVDLKERGKIANDADADLFVSIHCNAHHTQASGTETYVLGLHANKQNFEVAKHENSVIFMEDNYKEKYEGFDPNSPEAVIGMTLMQEEFLDESLLVASYTQDKFTKDLKRLDRGVKQAGFVVLHQTYMPSILIETGFITNKNEGAFLNSKSGQQRVAKAIAQAILKYKKHLDENYVYEAPKKNKTQKEPRVVEGVDFRVQIATSTKKLALKSYNFNGLKGVKRIKDGNFYKYYYGNTSDYDAINKMRSVAKKNGYPTAFVVAFKGDKKISVTNALLQRKK